jgi:[ribosomal protein S18]-alanine N-acetyltransferase
MRDHEPLTLRKLRDTDLPAILRILETSEYTHYRFSQDELPGLVARLPGVGAFGTPAGRLARVTQGSLRAFLLTNWLVPPSTWIGGFGVSWGEGARFANYLTALLTPLARLVAARGGIELYYSGSDLESDWLRGTLEGLGFTLKSLLRSYDKEDFAIPAEGSHSVRVRPFVPADVAGLVAIEDLSFAPLWRHDAAGFLEVAATYPYFVVAEDEYGIAGYQYNAVDVGTGYLVRIAVHPRAEGQGVGTRLMAEAVRYFREQHVWKIVLNTEEANTRAQMLYERFGFHQVPQRGFVLGADVARLAGMSR